MPPAQAMRTVRTRVGASTEPADGCSTVTEREASVAAPASSMREAESRPRRTTLPTSSSVGSFSRRSRRLRPPGSRTGRPAQAATEIDDPMFAAGYSGSRAYGRTKLARILFTTVLAGELADTGLRVNALHPATFVDTNIVLFGGGAAPELGGGEARGGNAAHPSRGRGERRELRRTEVGQGPPPDARLGGAGRVPAPARGTHRGPTRRRKADARWRDPAICIRGA